MPLRIIELHQAFSWTCEDCGRDHFERAITVDPESDMAHEAAHLVDLEEPCDGAFLMAPSSVQCPDCKAQFVTDEA